MSRIGKIPVEIPSGVNVTADKNTVTVTGPKGSLTLKVPSQITVEVKDNQVFVIRHSEAKSTKANHGTIRSHIKNMTLGVVTPYTKSLEVRGTGYKASVSGNKLTVLAGYIHPVVITAPEGISFNVTQDTQITVTGIDKAVVGQVASNIRKIRTPEPYKGKGVRYANEFIKLKAGKTAKA